MPISYTIENVNNTEVIYYIHLVNRGLYLTFAIKNNTKVNNIIDSFPFLFILMIG